MLSRCVRDPNRTAQLIGDRAVFNVRTNPVPFAGGYTLIIPSADENPAVPTGDGFGVAQETAAGLATMVGTLADGVRLTQRGAPLSQDGVWPLYVPRCDGKGLVMGWVTFANEPDSDLNAGLIWIEPAGARGGCSIRRVSTTNVNSSARATRCPQARRILYSASRMQRPPPAAISQPISLTPSRLA
jgi:hypothetical protein